MLHEGEQAGCGAAHWRVRDGCDLDTLAERLASEHVPFLREPRSPGIKAAGDCLNFVEPATGASLGFYVSRAQPGLADFIETHTAIQRLGHVVFGTPEAALGVEHARRWMDFRMSDWIAGGTSFLRPAQSPYHHGLGIAHAQTRQLHHLTFMVSTIDDVGRALHRLGSSTSWIPTA